jgi:hypothetical protein
MVYPVPDHTALIHPPADKQSIAIVVMQIVIFDEREGRSCARMQTGVSAA